MKAIQNIRILLFPIKSHLDRWTAESIENTQFKNSKQIDLVGASILTVEEFKRTHKAKKLNESLDIALSNIKSKNQCHKLTDFMDEYNNQKFKGKTDKYWMTYVRV